VQEELNGVGLVLGRAAVAWVEVAPLFEPIEVTFSRLSTLIIVPAISSNRIPIGLLAEREALAAARNQRTLTQDFCGDPPPGYSALHGKTGQR